MNGRRRGFALLAGGVAITIAVAVGGFASARDSASPETAPAGDVVAAAPVLLSQGKPTLASSSGGCCAAAERGRRQLGHPLGQRGGRRPAVAPGRPGRHGPAQPGPAAVGRFLRDGVPDRDLAQRHDLDLDHSARPTGDGGVDDLTVTGSGRYVRMFGTSRCRTGVELRLLAAGVPGLRRDRLGRHQPADAARAPRRWSASTSSSATIRWDASTDNVGVVAYHIFRDGQHCATVARHRRVQGSCSGLEPEPDVRLLRQRPGRGRQRLAGQRDAAGDDAAVERHPGRRPRPATCARRHRDQHQRLAGLERGDRQRGRGAATRSTDGDTQVGTATGTSTTLNGADAGHDVRAHRDGVGRQRQRGSGAATRSP